MKFPDLVACVLCAFVVSSLAEDSGIKTLVFETQHIEGKIRRPQFVLIKAELRPNFTPMVMQSLAGGASIVEFVSESVIEGSPYDEPFEFENTEISNYVP